MKQIGHKRNLPSFGLALLAAGALAACSGGSDSGTTGSSFTLDGIVGDAPIDDLVSFSTTVDEVRLVDANGAVTGDLLGANVPVEFLGLQTIGAWLFQSTPPKGTYTAARLVLVPGSTTARSISGAVVGVTEVATTFDIPLVPALTVGDDGYRQLIMDLNLAGSLTGDVAAPPIIFDPVGAAASASGAALLSIDDVKGLVVSADEAASTIDINAFVDDDLQIPLGRVQVVIPAAVTLINEDDSLFATQALFFAALTPGSTLVEVDGDLGADSTVTAAQIEIEDHNGGANSASVVKIEGRVTTHTPGTSFEMLLVEIEQGSSIADPVLSGLGSPSTITVSYDSMTAFVGEEHNSTSSGSLTVGETVDVKFNAFVGSPFLAASVKVDGSPEHNAFVQDASGAPSSIVVRLRPGETAIAAGLVATPMTDIIVDLSAAQVTLDADGEPVFDPSLLLQGVRVKIEGGIGGTPSAPTLAAIKVDVRPGEFDGAVTGINAGLSTFNSSVASMEDPLGFNVTTPPYAVVIDPTCIFDGDAEDEASFFALFTGLQPGEALEVQVKAIGTGVANEVRAYEIETSVQ